MNDEPTGSRRPAPKRYEGQPTGAVPVERQPGAMSRTTRNAIIVVLAVVVAATCSVLFGFFVLADRTEEESEQVFGSTDCAFISDGELSEALDAEIDGFQLGTAGLSDALADGRVALDGDTCLASSGEVDISVSLTKADGEDAATVFAEQREAAESSEGAPPFFGDDVTGLGDEAFCTTIDEGGYTGVLARSGDTLVYASVASPEVAPDADAGCALAARVAGALL